MTSEQGIKSREEGVGGDKLEKFLDKYLLGDVLLFTIKYSQPLMGLIENEVVNDYI